MYYYIYMCHSIGFHPKNSSIFLVRNRAEHSYSDEYGQFILFIKDMSKTK